MKITCPKCGRDIPAADIDIQTGVAHCAACHEGFSILNEVAAPLTGEASLGPKTEVPLPGGMKKKTRGDDLIITRWWYTPVAKGQLLFAVVWDGMIYLFFSLIDMNGGMRFDLQTLLGMTCSGLIIFPAIGVLFTYVAMTSFLNTTVVRVNNRLLTVRHYPLPYARGRTLPVDTIDQLYCARLRAFGGMGLPVYAVCARLKNGQSQTLVYGMKDPDQARYIEQEVEKRLVITDRIVNEEMYTA